MAENDLRTKLEPPFGNHRLHTLGLLTSRDVIISSQNHLADEVAEGFALGDGCWLPICVTGLETWLPATDPLPHTAPHTARHIEQPPLEEPIRVDFGRFGPKLAENGRKRPKFGPNSALRTGLVGVSRVGQSMCNFRRCRPGRWCSLLISLSKFSPGLAACSLASIRFHGHSAPGSSQRAPFQRAPSSSKILVHFYSEIIYAPPPPPPISGQKAFSRGGGWGCIFWGPTQQEFYTPPPFIHPPPLGGYFQGWGGWGCTKIGPVCNSSEILVKL